VRPSPARARPHDARAWLPLPDLEALPPVEGTLVVEKARPSAAPRGAAVRPVPSRPEPPVVRPSPARAEPHDPDTWFPLAAMEAMLAPDCLVDSGQTRAVTVTEPVPAIEPAPEPRPQPVPEPARRRSRGAAARRTDRALHRRRAMLVALAAATVAAGGATVPDLVTSSDVPDIHLRADGRALALESDAKTVRGLLRQEGIDVAPDDRVVPALATPVTDEMRVRVYRAFDLNVDVDGDASTVRTTYLRVGPLQRQLGLAPAEVDVYSAPDRLGADALVQFRTRKEVEVNIDGASITDVTLGLTVQEALNDYSVKLGPVDKVDPGLDTRLTDGLAITVVRVSNDKTEVVQQAVPYPTERQDDPSLPKGEEVVAQPGVPGAEDVTFRITEEDNVEVAREPMSRIPVTPPVPEIIRVGTALPNQRVGSASWYASPFGSDSCATKEYVPKGTIVTVTNTDTGASTTCRVADRVEANRVVDLDDDVFAQLAPLSQGVFNARIDWA
jgi:uncharacterized protein YabE (DUF348 family)